MDMPQPLYGAGIDHVTFIRIHGYENVDRIPYLVINFLKAYLAHLFAFARAQKIP
jgi:hypothetical protein